MEALLDHLASDYEARNPRHPYRSRCSARFIDLDPAAAAAGRAADSAKSSGRKEVGARSLSISVFVDSSVWFAAAVTRDRDNAMAKAVLTSNPRPVTTDYEAVQTWQLLAARYGRGVADRFWDGLRAAGVKLETVGAVDLEAAWAARDTFPEREFSLPDRISFAVMRRLGINRIASLDSRLSSWRTGPSGRPAFTLVSGHSDTFRLFAQAILERRPIHCDYKGEPVEIFPHVLGHKGSAESAHVYQPKGRPKGWRGIALREVENVTLGGGPWQTSRRQSAQRAVEEVYLDADPSLPGQPGCSG